MNMEQFENQFKNKSQIIPILIENGVPFVEHRDFMEIWLKDATIYLYSNDTFDSHNFNINQNIQYVNQGIKTLKEKIQKYQQNYIISKIENLENIGYIEENKKEIIISNQLIETAKYYESKSI